MPKGLTLAVPLGFLRGHVMVFLPSVQNLAEFLIAGNGWFVLVSTRPARKLHMSIAEIEAEFRDVITGLRLVPDGGQVSCELWLYSRYGTFRHFRVQKDGLVEINAYGTPLDQVKLPAAAVSSGGDDTGVPAGLPASAGPGTVRAEPTSPIIRWLRKWNAARLAGAKAASAENNSLKKVLNAGAPAVKKKRISKNKPAGKRPASGGPVDPENGYGAGEPGNGKTKPAGRKTVPENEQDPGAPPVPGNTEVPCTSSGETGAVYPVTGNTGTGSPEGGDRG